MAKTGRRPKPSNQKVMAGNPGKRPLDLESEPSFEACVPDPPPEIQGEALEEWRRAGPMLAAQKVLTAADMMVFALYCKAVARWRVAERGLLKAAKGDKDFEGLIQSGAPNPFLRVAKEASEQILKASVELGMTPAARTRVKMAGTQKANPFANNGQQKKKA